MTIEELLKKGDARVSIGNRWLIWCSHDMWMVLERKYYARENICHYRGNNLTDAIEILGAE